MTIDHKNIRQIANFTAILAAFGTNIAANLNPINGLTIGEISNTLFKDVLITPANYAFAIWGLIYLGLFSFAVYQALPQQKNNALLERISYLLVLSSAAQIVWVFAFLSRSFLLSLLAMFAILLSLIISYYRLQIGKKRISSRDKWFVQIPVSIYLAWISVATVVNVAIVLYNWSWNGWEIDPQIWSGIVLLLAGILVTIVALVRRDLAFVFVYIWAFLAISIRHLDKPIIFITAGLLSLLLLILVMFILARRRKSVAFVDRAS